MKTKLLTLLISTALLSACNDSVYLVIQLSIRV